MSSPSQPTERERNLELLADVPPDHLQMLVGIVRSKRSANSGNASNNRPAPAPLLKRPSDTSTNGGYGSYGAQNKRRALSESGTMPPSNWPTNEGFMNGTTPFYNPNLPMPTQAFRPDNMGVTAILPNRGRASSLNGQMGTAFDKTDFQNSNSHNGGMSSYQTPYPMNGLGGTQSGPMSYSQPQSSYALTGAANNWMSTPLPVSTGDASSAVFSSQPTPYSPGIPPSPNGPASHGSEPSLLSADWQPAPRSHSKSPTPTTDAISPCVQGPSSTSPGPAMGLGSLADITTAGLGNEDFWNLSASMSNSPSFPNADAAMTACTGPTQQILSTTSEPHQSPTEATDVASAMSDLTQQIEALRAENSDLKNRVSKLSSLQQESDKRSQADQDKNNQCRKDIELIYNELQGEFRALKESVVTYRGDK